MCVITNCDNPDVENFYKCKEHKCGHFNCGKMGIGKYGCKDHDQTRNYGLKQKNKKRNDEEKIRFVKGDIIKTEGDSFVCVVLGTSAEKAARQNIRDGDMCCIGSNFWSYEYDSSLNFYLVRCVIKHNNRYWYVPEIHSSASMEGSVNFERKLEYMGSIDYVDIIYDLDIEICKEICPGYLNS